MMNNIGLPGVFLIVLSLLVPVWLFYTIMRKAGFNPWWGLVAAIPGGAVILCFVLALSDWPALKRV